VRRPPRCGQGGDAKSDDLDQIDVDLSPTAWKVFGKEHVAAQMATRRNIVESARRRGEIP
jgi:hypothetical protein